MNCDCGWVGAVLSVLILLSVWPISVIPEMYGMWIVFISAVLLLAHSLFCKKCSGVMQKSGSSGRKARRKKK